ncbi:TPA: 16S rRNA (uracil(1498)-N(3))-methyltransferase [Candidatus Nomurabacteria bacterium]|nr:MAG: Ribosomal RNA small subunit methyltransferase E [Parcubacteria bacterium RAAC4_OD1_1]HCY26427.1 16S rRNA (uracil(1498)-N(3))-methyltransferase [Candidatus Nomurabacteria bacterium]
MKKIHRFITKYNREDDYLYVKDKDVLHQWKNVLRLNIGEEIIITSEHKKDFLVKIDELSRERAILKIIKEKINKSEPEKQVHLYLAILKKENFELALEKATEIGVKSITPIITERTIKTGLNIDRLKKIAKEASELSGRSTTPEINEIIKFEKAIENSKGEKIIFDIDGKKLEDENKKEVSIFIGPEGGWADNEINLAKEKGMRIAPISPLTLRAETAAIIASYIVLN